MSKQVAAARLPTEVNDLRSILDAMVAGNRPEGRPPPQLG
jgi:hypothetical protein